VFRWQELRDIALSAGSCLTVGFVIVFLADLGVLTPENAYWGDILVVVAEWFVLYIR
jgi:hypothetical protein